MNLQRVVEHQGTRLSSIGIGTWAIGGPQWTNGVPTGWNGPLDDDESIAGLRLAIDNGITHVDTADAYGNGHSERLVGRTIAGKSESLTIASKVGCTPTSAPSVYSPENIRFQLEQSLRNLRTDHIDIYYAHECEFGPDDMYLDAAVDEFNRLKQEGLIRSIALSGWPADALMRVGKVLHPDFIQGWASIEHPEFVDEDGPLARFMVDNQIGFIAMMPYGQGRLLGKYDATKPPTFRDGDSRAVNDEFTRESLMQFQPQLAQLKERFGESPADLITPALGFLLKHPTVVGVIPGYRNSNQVKELLAAVARPYTDDDHEFVKRLFPSARSNPHPWLDSPI